LYIKCNFNFEGLIKLFACMYAHADIVQSDALPSYADVVHFILHLLVFFFLCLFSKIVCWS